MSDVINCTAKAAVEKYGKLIGVSHYLHTSKSVYVEARMNQSGRGVVILRPIKKEGRIVMICRYIGLYDVVKLVPKGEFLPIRGTRFMHSLWKRECVIIDLSRRFVFYRFTDCRERRQFPRKDWKKYCDEVLGGPRQKYIDINKEDRNFVIFVDYLKNTNPVHIGEYYGLTPVRINQIVRSEKARLKIHKLFPDYEKGAHWVKKNSARILKVIQNAGS